MHAAYRHMSCLPCSHVCGCADNDVDDKSSFIHFHHQSFYYFPLYCLLFTHRYGVLFSLFKVCLLYSIVLREWCTVAAFTKSAVC